MCFKSFVRLCTILYGSKIQEVLDKSITFIYSSFFVNVCMRFSCVKEGARFISITCIRTPRSCLSSVFYFDFLFSLYIVLCYCKIWKSPSFSIFGFNSNVFGVEIVNIFRLRLSCLVYIVYFIVFRYTFFKGSFY